MFWNVQIEEQEIIFEDQRKGSLSGKYRITTDEKNKEAHLYVEYHKGTMRLYGGLAMFSLIGLFTGFGFGYLLVGLFFGSPSFLFLYLLRGAEERNNRRMKKDVALIITQLAPVTTSESVTDQ